ncbi:hypothetical protein GCM10009566_20590 [Streptomyces murinus]
MGRGHWTAVPRVPPARGRPRFPGPSGSGSSHPRGGQQMNTILELQELPVDQIDGEGEVALMSTASNHCLTID